MSRVAGGAGAPRHVRRRVFADNTGIDVDVRVQAICAGVSGAAAGAAVAQTQRFAAMKTAARAAAPRTAESGAGCV